MAGETKLVRVKKRTWERLKKHGMMQESFDQLINRILDELERGKR